MQHAIELFDMNPASASVKHGIFDLLDAAPIFTMATTLEAIFQKPNRRNPYIDFPSLLAPALRVLILKRRPRLCPYAKIERQ